MVRILVVLTFSVVGRDVTFERRGVEAAFEKVVTEKSTSSNTIREKRLFSSFGNCFLDSTSWNKILLNMLQEINSKNSNENQNLH